MTDAPDSRVIFPLEVDEEGWPPVGSERVWAYALGEDRYRVDNAPWFVRDLAIGDVVEAIAPDPESHPVFTRILEKSDHLTIRLVCFRAGPLAGDLQAILDVFVPLGAYGEGASQYAMVALDIPAGVPLHPIYDRLKQGRTDGWWDWEEGRINTEWIELEPSGEEQM
jgi:hypothetical protein